MTLLPQALCRALGVKIGSSTLSLELRTQEAPALQTASLLRPGR
jgi:hypothetical protein